MCSWCGKREVSQDGGSTEFCSRACDDDSSKALAAARLADQNYQFGSLEDLAERIVEDLRLWGCIGDRNFVGSLDEVVAVDVVWETLNEGGF